MNTIIIPPTKTNCGEIFYGSFLYKDNKMTLELFFQGSQLLEQVGISFINIVQNRPIRYLQLAERIFWRINTLPLQGSRREMAKETIIFLSSYILLRINH